MVAGHSSVVLEQQYSQGHLHPKPSLLAKDNDQDVDDEFFEEPPEQRAILKSLANIPGITASDSMSYRIEALRVHLENQMGDELFVNAYKHLTNLSGDDEAQDNVLESMLHKKIKFVPLIHQLIVCEDSYYGNT